MGHEGEQDRGQPGPVSRRGFPRCSAVAGALAGAGGASELVAARPAAAASGGDGVPRFRWEEATIAQLQAAMAEGRLSARELTAAYLAALRTSKRLMQQAIDGVMDRLDLDAIVSLTGSPSWTTGLVNGDHFLTASSTPAAVAGYPSITVPAGFSFEHLLVGISFIGRRRSEPTLIKLAHAFERGTGARHAPEFLASLGVRGFVPRRTWVRDKLRTGGARRGGRERMVPDRRPQMGRCDRTV
jgi:hypothetical protein